MTRSLATETGNGQQIEKAPHAGEVFGTDWQPGIGGLGGARNMPLDKVHVFWFAGMSCDGCSISVTGATSPSVEDLLAGRIPGLPKVVLHHPVLSVAAGNGFIEPFRAAARGELDAPYVIVLEGSIPDDQAIPQGEGYFSAMGAGGLNEDEGTEQPNRVTDWVKELAPGAAAAVAIGTCATWGGIPAAAGNITGSMSLMDFLGKNYRSALGVPVVNVPGCAPQGDNFTETVVGVLMFLQGLGPLPEFDELGRPAWLFEETVHRHCPRAGYYEEGDFAHEYGDQQCLVHVGCWGPVVQCNITERGAINHMGGCMVAGGPCIGCTMPGFPDKMSPFYESPPGSALSGGFSTAYGAAIRRLRRVTMRSDNFEPLWDKTGEVPSAWAREQRQPTTASKVMGFFYKKMQYRGSVDYRKRYKDQPIPKSLAILEQDEVEQDVARYTEADPHREEGADIEKES